MALKFFSSLVTFVTICVSTGVHAAIGPVTSLHIVNRNISPDGFSRPAVLAGGTFPGPVLKGHMVSIPVIVKRSSGSPTTQNDNFRITVFDDLTNPDMLTDTSIVRSVVPLPSTPRVSYQCIISALAWFLPKGYQLGRWRCFCHAVSYHQWKLLRLQFPSPWTSW